jgi:hypothetical protein
VLQQLAPAAAGWLVLYAAERELLVGQPQLQWLLGPLLR